MTLAISEISGVRGGERLIAALARGGRGANETEGKAALYVAEARAVRAVFVLRMQEREIEDAHALVLRGQREDMERARMMARGS